MSGFVSALTNATSGLTASSFSTILTDFVPWYVVMIPLSFGLKLVFRAIRRAANGRA